MDVPSQVAKRPQRLGLRGYADVTLKKLLVGLESELGADAPDLGFCVVVVRC